GSGGRGPAAVRVAGARRPGARLAPAADRGVGAGRPGLQRARAPDRGPPAHDRGRQRHHEPRHGADVDLLRDLLLHGALSGRDAAAGPGASPDRAQRRPARRDARGRGSRRAAAGAGAARGMGRGELRRGLEGVPLAVASTGGSMRTALCLAVAAVAVVPAASGPPASASISAGQVRVEFDARLRTRVVALRGPDEVVLGPFAASESVSAGATEIDDFAFEGRSEERIEDRMGPGRRLTVTGRSKDPAIVKAVSVSVYEAFPRVAVMQ